MAKAAFLVEPLSIDLSGIPQADIFLPLDGIHSIFELGNKRTGAGIVYKRVFEAAGFRHVSVDWNGEDGALKLDLRKPLNLGTFDMVTNFGTSEHVEGNQDVVWKNMVDACDKILICSTPMPGDWTWHGIYYPTVDFYRQLAALNGFTIERSDIWANPPRRNIRMRMIRTERRPFVMPDEKLMFINKVRKRRK